MALPEITKSGELVKAHNESQADRLLENVKQLVTGSMGNYFECSGMYKYETERYIDVKLLKLHMAFFPKGILGK